MKYSTDHIKSHAKDYVNHNARQRYNNRAKLESKTKKMIKEKF